MQMYMQNWNLKPMINLKQSLFLFILVLILFSNIDEKYHFLFVLRINKG